MDVVSKFLCEPHHVAIMLLVFFAMLLVLGSGKGLEKIMGFFKPKGDVVVNVKENHESIPASCPFPDGCNAHKAEYERSIRNQADIAKLEREFDEFKGRFFAKLESIETGINEIKIEIVKRHNH
jgi:hypothetical protein